MRLNQKGKYGTHFERISIDKVKFQAEMGLMS